MSLILRLALVFAITSGVIALPAFESPVMADDDDWDDDDDDDDDDEEDEDYEQPPVTSGGLFTKRTYPVEELQRPLTLIKGMTELRGGFDIDVSDQQAFEIWKLRLDGRYGLKDHIELQAAGSFLLTGEFMSADLKPPSFIELGFESAVSYDVVDFRLTTIWVVDPDFTFDIAFGFPVRYRVKPNVAIVALDKIMTIHTESVPEPNEMGELEDNGKPDLTVGVGIIFQAVKKLAILGRGEIIVPRFNTENVFIPVSVNIQFSPNNKVDLGGEFTLGDVINDEDPIANRSLLLYGQIRL